MASSQRSAPIGTIEQLFLLVPLVVVPLGLLLVQSGGALGRGALFVQVAAVLQPVAALLVVASFLIPKGILAALLARLLDRPAAAESG